ncbi:MAG: YqaA family protein [Fidelibacterota bacterium]
MRGAIRKLYDWVLHWADTPYGPAALFVLAFAESSFFPVPPDVLLIALALGSRHKSLRFALICSLASLLGGMAGYGIGYFAWWQGEGTFSSVALFFYDHVPGFDENLFYQIKAQYDRWNFLVVFTAGFTLIPYKVFTISAGAFHINFPLFVLASGISRSARFFLVSALIRRYGQPIRVFIEKYLDWLALAFTLLLVGGFVLVKAVF